MRGTSNFTIRQMKEAVRSGGRPLTLRGQIEELAKRESANGKPFWELRIRDHDDALVLRAWTDTESFRDCEDFQRGDFVAVEGEFLINGNFGPDARRWRLFPLPPAEIADLLAGSPEAREKTAGEMAFLGEQVAAITDPRLRELCASFLEQYGPRFARSAAARINHHARRGGLLDHTAQMMRSALAIASVYPQLNRDLLVAGVLFHDSGKLWETCAPESGFGIQHELRGDLLGHISIGIELVNSLWNKLDKTAWKELQPPSEDVRLHLLHLIASHHGEMQYGSPVLPKTPEAAALHYIDNLDARLEMFSDAYRRTPAADAASTLDFVKTLGVAPVPPLPVAGTNEEA